MKLIILLICLYNVAGHIPSYANESMTYPYKNFAVVGKDGYATFAPHFEDNADSCPTQKKHECCKCKPNYGCDDTKPDGPCQEGDRPCKTENHNTAYGCGHILPIKQIVENKFKPLKYCSGNGGNYTYMSRKNLVERAIGWVTNSFFYAYGNGVGGCILETCGSEDTYPDCPRHTYEAVCNGLVASAWRLPNQNPDNGNSIAIECNKDVIKPGDACHLKAPHWLMFRRFINSTTLDGALDEVDSIHERTSLLQYYKINKSLPRVQYYQMGGGRGKANIFYDEWKPWSFRQCWKRKYLIEDM